MVALVKRKVLDWHMETSRYGEPSREAIIFSAAQYVRKSPAEFGQLRIKDYFDLHKTRSAQDLIEKQGPRNPFNFSCSYLLVASIVELQDKLWGLNGSTLMKDILPYVKFISVDKAVTQYPKAPETPVLKDCFIKRCSA